MIRHHFKESSIHVGCYHCSGHSVLKFFWKRRLKKSKKKKFSHALSWAVGLWSRASLFKWVWKWFFRIFEQKRCCYFKRVKKKHFLSWETVFCHSVEYTLNLRHINMANKYLTFIASNNCTNKYLLSIEKIKKRVVASFCFSLSAFFHFFYLFRHMLFY